MVGSVGRQIIKFRQRSEDSFLQERGKDETSLKHGVRGDNTTQVKDSKSPLKTSKNINNGKTLYEYKQRNIQKQDESQIVEKNSAHRRSEIVFGGNGDSDSYLEQLELRGKLRDYRTRNDSSVKENDQYRLMELRGDSEHCNVAFGQLIELSGYSREDILFAFDFFIRDHVMSLEKEPKGIQKAMVLDVTCQESDRYGALVLHGKTAVFLGPVWSKELFSDLRNSLANYGFSIENIVHMPQRAFGVECVDDKGKAFRQTTHKFLSTDCSGQFIANLLYLYPDFNNTFENGKDLARQIGRTEYEGLKIQLKHPSQVQLINPKSCERLQMLLRLQ